MRDPKENGSNTSEFDENLILKKAFEEHAAKTISEEQKRRVLELPLEMISEGAFDKQYAFTPRLRTAVAVVAAILVILLAAAFAGGGIVRDVFFTQRANVASPHVNLSHAEYAYELFAHVILPDRDLRDAKFLIIDEISMETVYTAVLGADGSYRFEHLADGSYDVIAVLPAYPPEEQYVEIGKMIVSNGRIRLIVDEESSIIVE